jgi:cysteine desulfurase
MHEIYLDHAATTPVREEVREAMASTLTESFGNPSSHHGWGRRAAATLDESRERIATGIGAEVDEIYFVRGGTESDNLAILGRADVAESKGETPVVVVSAVEHKAVLESSARVEERGGRCVVLEVREDGTLDLDMLEHVLAERPTLVSIMTVNNEVGIRLPLEQVAERTEAHGVVLHSDAVQALGKTPVHVDTPHVDLLTLTGHKIGGPRGTGVLFVRRGVEIAPLLYGGGQERALRPGTEDVAGAVGMSMAVALAVGEQESEAGRMGDLNKTLESSLVEGIAGLRIHGKEARRAPHILNVGIPEVDPEALLAALDLEGIAVSGGSACESGGQAQSHVLKALYGEADRFAALRFSLGHTTNRQDVATAATTTVAVVDRIRSRAAGA